MRLIDADELIQEIRENNEGYYFNSSAEREANFAKVDYAIDRIREAPTIEERPQGEWIIKSNGTTNYHACSECGHAGDFQDKFCRDCGADMRGKENVSSSDSVQRRNRARVQEDSVFRQIPLVHRLD